MKVFITGGTGYLGKRLIKELLKRNHAVKALVRKGSEHKLPQGCEIIFGDALKASTFLNEIKDADTFVHLVGVAHPSPNKKAQFQTIDLFSIKESVEAINKLSLKNIHLVYLSVSPIPTSLMKDYQQARTQGEAIIKQSNIHATFIRPLYVIGPGHYWPLLILPVLKLLELIPSTREKAKALRLVYLPQMIRSLVYAVEHPAKGICTMEIEEIRKK